MDTVQLLIVHSQPIVVTGIETLVSHLNGWQIIGTTAHASAALQFVRHTPPDIAVVEYQLPGLNGIALCALLHAHMPQLASAIVGDLTAAQQLQAAAHGVGLFIPPAINSREMAELAIQLNHVPRPRTSYHTLATLHGLRQLMQQTSNEARFRSATFLSEREQCIMQWVARGYSNKAVADMLGISPHTVKQHLDNIYAKCHVHNRAAVVAMALKWGWIDAV